MKKARQQHGCAAAEPREISVEEMMPEPKVES